MSGPYSTLDRIEDTLDLKGLLLLLWKKKSIIMATALFTSFLSIIYAFKFAKTEYISSALLVPIQSSASSEISAATVFLGKRNMGNGDGDLFQSLLTSRTVIHKLLGSPIRDGKETSGRIRTLAQIMKIDTSDPKRMDREIRSLKRSVSVESKDGSGGILEIRFTATSALLAQQIGNNLLDIGLNELQRIRFERSNVVISRLAAAALQAKEELDAAENALLNYKVRNRSITLPDQMLALSRIEMETSAKEQKYLLARKELEVLCLEQAKAAPPMMILDPANLPTTKSKPQRMIIVSCGVLLGILGAMLFVIVSSQINMESKGSEKE